MKPGLGIPMPEQDITQDLQKVADKIGAKDDKEVVYKQLVSSKPFLLES
jgi:hypothetical protein